jgi:hypothetical protein
LSFRGAVLSLGAALACSLFDGAIARAQWQGDDGDDGHRPVYQRHAFDHRRDNRRDRRDFRRDTRRMSPPISAGWFQRPYPYHLDYYKMRYGGSYAPYFGNLYGPPQVVTAPPYYGPYYGGYGGEYGNGYAVPNYDGVPAEYPPGYGVMMPGMGSNAVEAPNGGPPAQAGEELPAAK